jgi:hypothetical protein
MDPMPEPSIQDFVRQTFDMALLETRLGQFLLEVGPEGAEIPDDVGIEDIIHFASVAFAAIRRVCVDLGGEIDGLRARCAALEEPR